MSIKQTQIQEISNDLSAASELLKKLSEGPVDRAVLEQLTALIGQSRQRAEEATEKDPFDQARYDQKIDKLLSFSNPIAIEVLKDLPRDCDVTVQKTYMKRKDGKFNKMAIVRLKNTNTGKVWTQIVCIQEFEQLDKHAAYKEIGQEFLPIRFGASGQLEAAFTVKNPVGALGTPVFYIPGGSNSNDNQLAFQKWPDEKAIILKGIRRDSNRMTGQIKTGIALVSSADDQRLDYDKERVVWFTIPELDALKKDPRFCEASTNYLAAHLLGNLPEIKSELAKRG